MFWRFSYSASQLQTLLEKEVSILFFLVFKSNFIFNLISFKEHNNSGNNRRR